MPQKTKKDRKNALEARFKFGIWAGIVPRTGEYTILTPEGQTKARSIKPLPNDKKWDRLFLESCKGAPRDQEGIADESESVEIVPNPDEPSEIPEQLEREDLAVRRLKITKHDLKKFKPTPGCKGCIANQQKRVGIPHDKECRKRLEEAIGSTPAGADRIRKVEESMNEAIARRLSKSEATREMRAWSQEA